MSFCSLPPDEFHRQLSSKLSAASLQPSEVGSAPPPPVPDRTAPATPRAEEPLTPDRVTHVPPVMPSPRSDRAGYAHDHVVASRSGLISRNFSNASLASLNHEDEQRDWLEGPHPINAQLKDIWFSNQPELDSLLKTATAKPILGSGKSAAGFPLPDHDALMLRVALPALKYNNKIDLSVVRCNDVGEREPLIMRPVRYGGKLEGLTNDPRLGIPRAVMFRERAVRNGEYLADFHSFTPAEALQEKEVAFDAHAKVFDVYDGVMIWLLNRCHGEHPTSTYSEAAAAMEVSPAVAHQIVRQQQLWKEISLLARARAGAPMTREERKLRADFDRASDAEDLANRNICNVEHQRMHAHLLDQLEEIYTSGKPEDLTNRLAAVQALLEAAAHGTWQTRDVNNRRLSPPAEIQRGYAAAHRAYIEAYRKGLDRIADLPQSAFDDAMTSIKRIQAAGPKVCIDLVHSNNTLIDFEKGTISFVDLNFTGQRSKGSPDELLGVLLGKNMWRPVVSVEDRAACAQPVRRIYNKIATAADTQGVAWLPDEQNHEFRHVAELFSLPVHMIR